MFTFPKINFARWILEGLMLGALIGRSGFSSTRSIADGDIECIGILGYTMLGLLTHQNGVATDIQWQIDRRGELYSLIYMHLLFSLNRTAIQNDLHRRAARLEVPAMDHDRAG